MTDFSPSFPAVLPIDPENEAYWHEAMRAALEPIVGQVYTPMSVELAKARVMKVMQAFMPTLKKRIRVKTDYDQTTHSLNFGFEEEDANGKAWSDYEGKRLYQQDGRPVFPLYAVWGSDGLLELALVDAITSARIPNTPAAILSFAVPT